MIEPDFLSYIKGYPGEGRYAVLSLKNNRHKSYYLTRKKTQYLPFRIRYNKQLEFILFELFNTI